MNNNEPVVAEEAEALAAEQRRARDEVIIVNITASTNK